MNPGALPVSTSAMALMVLVVQEDVKRVDAAIFELRNVHPIDDGRRACRTEPPVQSPNVVIPGRGSHRREFEFGGKGDLKRCNCVADCLPPLKPLFSFEENRVLGIEALDRSHSALAVPPAEYFGEILQHEICQ